MNGIHDMGGMHGMGKIVQEADEPVFHHEWEAHTLALARVALAGFQFNLDEFRHAMERIEPSYYLSSSYYERWLEGTITLLTEKNIITAGEFEARLNEIKAEQN